MSVVLPAYNAAATLGDAVASILRQSLNTIELIVVDDGSTDETQAVLSRIDDPRLTVIRHSQNRGHVVALESAIACARAPIIARMDADDTADPDRLRCEHDILAHRPSVGLVATAFVSVAPDGREIRRHGVPPDHAASWFRLHFANCLAHPTVMFRRSAYDTVGGYRQDVVPAEDHDLWIRMAEVTEIATIPDPLLRYRRSSTSLSARFGRATEQASIEVSARAIERVTGRRPPDRVLRGLRAPVPVLGCSDAAAALEAIALVHTAVARACGARNIPTDSLPGQVAALMQKSGLRDQDGSWCVRALARMVAHHPRAAVDLARARLASRRQRGTGSAAPPPAHARDG